jgi:hypothetical protein
MIEHLKEDIPGPLLDERLRSLGRDGWIPWYMSISGIPGNHITYATVRFWRQLVAMLLLCLFFAGCAAELKAVPVKVGDKTKYYVIGNTKIGVLGDEVATIDRYDENGVLQHPSDISTTGTVHDVLKAAAGSTGTAAVMTPVVGDLIPATTAVVAPAEKK